jgi:predicted MFS family arabinose efflux permease
VTPHQTPQSGENRIPKARIAALGLITITVYGGWFYSFGVLLDPIIADTGWSEPSVAAVFGSSTLIAAFGSLAGGWLLDRLGSRAVFAFAAVAGTVSFLVAAEATTPAVFAVAGSIGGGTLASLGFYHVTQTAAVRISPGSEDRAIAVLTIWGAFASAIYIPLTAWLVSEFDWRVTLRVIALSAFVSLTAGALVIDTRQRDVARSRIFGDMGAALRTGQARRFMTSQVLAGLAVGTILVYQVPAMTSAGLALGVASFWAGFRGFAQLGGRLPLMPMVRRLGIANTLRLAYLAIAVGSLALAFAGNPILAGVYALAAGFGIGAVSPLIGMHSKQVFGAASLGTAMGMVSLGFLVANSIGPIAAAWAAEETGSRAIPVAVSAAVMVGAALVIKASD